MNTKKVSILKELVNTNLERSCQLHIIYVILLLTALYIYIRILISNTCFTKQNNNGYVVMTKPFFSISILLVICTVIVLRHILKRRRT